MSRPSSALTAALIAIALLAIAIPTLVVTHPPAMPASAHRVPPQLALPQRVVPPAELPPVEPVSFVDLAPDDARAYNAGVPFFDGPNPPARPFHYTGSADDLAKATDCLAVAVAYEAGDDTVGERAVAQVVLNRLRHPAFPKTVCGVVFQGSERTTGCQFTFACDGALARWHPSDAAWQRARDVAEQALSGAVFKPVGYATHYHTDWVVPYWQSSLDKIAAVHSHLFFRWSGWWGTPPAFNRQLLPGEPLEPQIAALSDAHRLDAALADSDAAVAGAVSLTERGLAPLPSDPNTFLTTLDPREPPEKYNLLALTACGDRPTCKVMGWTDPGAMAFTLPLTADQVAALSFSYLRDRAAGFDKVLWNCTEFPKAPPSACMKRQVLRAAATAPEPAAPPAPALASPPARLTDELGGVHRKPAASPGPAPTATPTSTPGKRSAEAAP